MTGAKHPAWIDDDKLQAVGDELGGLGFGCTFAGFVLRVVFRRDARHGFVADFAGTSWTERKHCRSPHDAIDAQLASRRANVLHAVAVNVDVGLWIGGPIFRVASQVINLRAALHAAA